MTLATRFGVQPTVASCDRLLLRVLHSVAGLNEKAPAERWALIRRALDEHNDAVRALTRHADGALD